MKAYLITTGALFGLLAVMHLLLAITEWHLLTTEPWHFLSMAALGVLSATLSVWAWQLLRRRVRS